jgi:hypothetical protein
MKRIYSALLCGVLFLSLILIAPLFAADNVFKEKGYGYTINYPQDWVYVKKSLHEIVFTKNTKADASTPVVGIQNLYSTNVKGGKFKDIKDVVTVFENQLKITKNANVYPVETYIYDKNGVKITGKQFIAEYVYKNNNYKQLVIVIPRKSEELFHVWIYSAQAEQYDKYFPAVRTMLDSWIITE